MTRPRGGWKQSQESNMKRSVALRGERNGQWKGDNISAHSVHQWVRNRLPVPTLCQWPGCEKPPFDLANVTGIYSRDFKNWVYYCRSHHMLMDFRNGIRNGPVFTAESRKKLSDSLKGLMAGENNPMYGKQHSQETKLKISQSKIGSIPWNKGKRGFLPPDAIEKIIKNNKEHPRKRDPRTGKFTR